MEHEVQVKRYILKLSINILEKLSNDVTEHTKNCNFFQRCIYRRKALPFPCGRQRELSLIFSSFSLQLNLYFLSVLHFLFKSPKKGTGRDLRVLEGQAGSSLLVKSSLMVHIWTHHLNIDYFLHTNIQALITEFLGEFIHTMSKKG